MRNRELVALMRGVAAGRVRQDPRSGRLGFTYDDSWRERTDAIPLSLSMPLAAREHGHGPIDAFLWGLLPDNEFVLERWARRFHVSARNAFSLLSAVGEDCQGAVQFVPQDRVDSLSSPAGIEAEWLREEDVAGRLRALREDHAAWRLADDRGQFSLAGSQPKTALLLLDGRWGVPVGRTPTTHILKPPLAGLDGHVENEHLCLLLAREVGLPTATSEVRRFGDEVAIVVERFDRVRTAMLAGDASGEAATNAARAATEASAGGGPLRDPVRTQPILRLHQEDMCQALGLRPSLKYQNEGGPAPADIVRLLREHSGRPEEDAETFLDALVFNWLIGGTDAHAKNFSLLHGEGGRVRLAPLYDLASALPYPGMDPRRVTLAMRIGSKYRLHEIGRRHWRSLAGELALDPERTTARMVGLAGALADAVPRVRARVVAEGLDHPIVQRLLELVAQRATDCRRGLAGPAS